MKTVNGRHIGLVWVLMAGSVANLATLPVTLNPWHQTQHMVTYPQRIRKIKVPVLLLKTTNDPESFGKVKQLFAKQKWNKKKRHG